ncbi:hypothetical protein, partial [Streptomyces violascens]|uniref:hypothetical protein n=1 Tax=Streptomyces violascens TaxID=67381 RepID=UPI0036B27EA7
MSAIKIRKLSIKGRWVRCPGRGSGDVPRQLTLFPSGAHVVATCGTMHRDAAKSRGSRAQCMFQVEGLSAQQLGTIAQAEKGKPFRLKLAAGTVEGVLVEVGASSRPCPGPPPPGARAAHYGGGARAPPPLPRATRGRGADTP